MSKVLLDLKGYQITDTGEVFVKYDALVDMFRSATRPDSITVLPNHDVDIFNARHPDRPISVKAPDGMKENPPTDSYRFDIPGKYLEIDLDNYLGQRLVEQFPDVSDPYVERLTLELSMIRVREMEDFLRALIYMMDLFAENKVVHGIGRGSSCASLILFLIGTHMVDPIKYEIPIEEFLR